MHRFYSSILLAFLVTGSAIFAGPEGETSDKNSWPQWRGVHQDGKTDADNVFPAGSFGLKTAWRVKLGQGYSSVSIKDGRAVTMFTDGTSDVLIALDAANGKEAWRYTVNDIYVGKGGSHNGPSSTPLIDDGMVYALGRKGQLVAVDAASGKEAWTRDIKSKDDAGEPFHGFTTAPVIFDDVLIVETGGSAGNTITGLSKKSGERLWTTGQDQVEYHSPVVCTIDGVDQVVCSGKNFIYGLDPQSGKTLWEYEHKGQGSSITPVKVDANRLLVQANFREASLLQINPASQSFSVEEVWKSRDIKNSFNVPIYKDGYFYSYSGRFLNCVDANTGETVWKSRPPGDGFIILVDNHLVILTKTGTLHIAEATPDGYKEKANLALFDGVAWTPPSFANGRVYARSLEEVASVDITTTVTGITIEEPERSLTAPNSAFAGFVNKLKEASDKAAMLDTWMARQKQFPVIEGNELAHIVYRGEVRDLVLAGDMFDQGVEENMFHVEGSDFYYYTLKLPPDAHIGYQFVRNFEERIGDPLNPQTVANFNGPESELAMPLWKKPAHLLEAPAGKKGTLTDRTFSSEIMGDTRAVKVYLPAGYDKSKDRYPVVYVGYGDMAADAGAMPNSLDNLIAANQIRPVIVVFMLPSRNRFQEYARDNKANHSKMIVEEMIPFIDATLRTTGKAADRLIMGGDEGGYVALYTSLKHPGSFGLAATQSSHLMSAEGQELRALIRSVTANRPGIYMDWGSMDYRSVAGDYNWTTENREVSSLFKELGYTISAKEYNSGFGWTSWRARTDVLLKNFFGK